MAGYADSMGGGRNETKLGRLGGGTGTFWMGGGERKRRASRSFPGAFERKRRADFDERGGEVERKRRVNGQGKGIRLPERDGVILEGKR